ncbi:MAG: spore coat protein [Bacillota bacterium]|nr:spore coat protein [Bacillota bacterium]
MIIVVCRIRKTGDVMINNHYALQRKTGGIVLSPNDSRDLNEYLMSCDIHVVDYLEPRALIEPLSQEQINSHITLISEFHQKTMGLSGFTGGRIDNCTGKKVEQFKVYIKKLKRDIKRINTNGPLNAFEEIVMEKAPEYLERAENCIKVIYDNGYFKLIERSMKRNELCLGNAYVDNLVKDGVIKIRSTKKLCYNMVECDLVYFLGKLKRRMKKTMLMESIIEFCRLEELDESSERFILASLSYPSEFMKTCEKHRCGKKNWDDNEYIKKLISSIEKDGEFLL